MKKIVLILFLTISSISYSQTVNGFELDKIPAEYIMLVGTQKTFKFYQVTLYVDYGQISTSKEAKKGFVLDSIGKRMSFNGMMGAINVFSKKGWEFKDAYPISGGSSTVYHYLMKKKAITAKE